jgi:uncharacterized membrane protein YfcA
MKLLEFSILGLIGIALLIPIFVGESPEVAAVPLNLFLSNVLLVIAISLALFRKKEKDTNRKVHIMERLSVVAMGVVLAFTAGSFDPANGMLLVFSIIIVIISLLIAFVKL